MKMTEKQKYYARFATNIVGLLLSHAITREEAIKKIYDLLNEIAV